MEHLKDSPGVLNDTDLSQAANTIGNQLGITDNTDAVLIWALESVISKIFLNFSLVVNQVNASNKQ